MGLPLRPSTRCGQSRFPPTWGSRPTSSTTTSFPSPQPSLPAPRSPSRTTPWASSSRSFTQTWIRTPPALPAVSPCSSPAPWLLLSTSPLLIQYTSPLTYHVVGHGKLILILTFGVLFLNSPISLKVATGMLGAVVGVMWYTYIKYNETPPPPPVQDVKV